MTFVLSTRQLWVEHLEPFQSEIREILDTFLASGTVSLQQALRRFCAQLVDLNATFALSVTSHIIQNTIVEMEKHVEQPEGSEVTNEEEAANENKKTPRCNIYLYTYGPQCSICTSMYHNIISIYIVT